VGVAPGIATGRVLIINRALDTVLKIKLAEGQGEDEVRRYRQSLATAEKEIQQLEEKAKALFDADIASVFHAHLLMVRDDTFQRAIPEAILRLRVNAEWVVQQEVAAITDKLKSAKEAYLRERTMDLEDVAKHVLSALQSIEHPTLDALQEKAVVVSIDLAPSDIPYLHHPNIVGFATQVGGRTSHTAIMAKALAMPAVLSVPGLLDAVKDGQKIIVDGGQGTVILNPDAATQKEYANKKDILEERQRRRLGAIHAPDTTRDGVDFHLLANIELLDEINGIKDMGGSGIGLYRSEFLYLSMYPHIPSEEDHFQTYSRLLKAMPDRAVTIRTFDLGGRKLAREVLHIHEDNPVLGMRGIRLCLNYPDIFRPQLKALLRASVYGNLHIMLPMVCCVEEVLRTRRLLEELSTELTKARVPHKRHIPLGIMVEVPSAAILVDTFAKHVDFFSIGTNDLIQYTLAVDRNNPKVAEYYNALHPAILTLIHKIAEAGRRHGKPVTVCGEMASDPLHAAVLMGLGVRSFSMEPFSLPILKETLRAASVKELEPVVLKALTLPDAKGVAEWLLERLSLQIPEGFLCPL
jgi:phosphotransferase system enzyme I (PtsI)